MLPFWRPLPLVCALVLPAAAQDEGSSTGAPKGLIPVPDFAAPSAPYLSGDWGGRRAELADKGLQVDFVWTQVGQGVLDGGRDTGWRYGGKLDTFWKLDLDRMGLLPGGLLNMTTESRYGRSVNDIAGVVLPVNDVLFFPITDENDEDVPIAITELRYTQFLSKQLGLFLGKFVVLGGDANEFAGGRGDTQFMSHSFLSASVTALVNPYSTLGGGLVVLPSSNLVITSSIYSSTDSSTTTGFDDLDDGWIWSTSVRGQYEVSGLPGGMMLTGQYGFDNEFVDFNGQFLGDGGIQIPLEGDTWNVFWNGWQYLRVDDDSNRPIDVTNGKTDRRGWGLFGRAAAADRDTNPVPWVFSAGIAGLGVAGRDRDTFGVGYAYGRVRDEPIVTGPVFDDQSHRFEAYYGVGVAPGADLTFSVQYADSMIADVDPATIAGVRLRLQF